MLGYKSYLLLHTLLTATFFAQAQSVICTPNRLTFAESVAVGGTSPSLSFTVTAQNFKGDVRVQPGSQVQVSLSNSDYGSYSRNPITIPAGDMAAGKTVYARFAPTCSGWPDSAITSSVILLNQRNELLGSVVVAGVVQQENAMGGLPFKVATLNAEWLGCPDNGPSNESLQMRNVAALIGSVGADVVALQEVTDNPTKSLDTVLSYLGSAWGGYILPYSSSRCAQSEAIIYKKDRISLASTPRLMSNAGTRDAWSSGRYPVEFEVDLTSENGNIPITLVNLHAKAYRDADSYNRRVEASKGLKTFFDDNSYSSKNLIALGDYNDDIDVSTYNSQASPYKNFADDTLRYRFLTGQISAASSLIDHIMISKALFSYYVPGSAQLETDVTASIDRYSTTTSDHTPVSATFAFGKQAQEIPVADRYDVLIGAEDFEMPAVSTGNLQLSYAIDSGVAVSLKNRTITPFGTGTVRMAAWQQGDVSFAPAAKFFYIQAIDHSIAPKIVAQPTDRKVELRETVVFSVQATGTQLRYQWKKDGRNITGATSFRYTISNAGNSNIGCYSCVVSNDMGSEESQAARLCVNTSCPTTAVQENIFEDYLKIYPNPARHAFSVESIGGNISSLRVCSISGAVVYEQKTAGASTLSISTSGWSEGIYVITVTLDKWRKAVSKILIIVSSKS
ncbi:MAG: T9SS type A sorting domain-containing protein [Prevotellaceae bacterium]|jgi:endonuclease/exonuclease/phosphatase family metal-dependent hydrolase|nr:T9SS type A sorting domain-containing protein [Prevotellaceae bacterium]